MKDPESIFLHYGGPVRLVQACLNAGNAWKGCFNRRARAGKRVQACLSARKDRESSFHHCGGPVRLVQACLNAGKVWKCCASAMKHV